MSKKNLVMLVIMDGFGIRENTYGNAIAAAKKPNLDRIFAKYPHTLIQASGEAVGLPEGQMGNSEVGHMNIGAGRVVFQSLTRVNIAVRDKTLDKMPAIHEAIEHAKKNHSALHVMGLMSDGGVHSHINHIIYLMNAAREAGVEQVYVHAFLDGRDVPPKSAKEYLTMLQDACHEGVKIGVVTGRYYAMDRDKNYDRTQLAYNALVYGDAPVKGLLEGIDESYAEDVTDEFVKPYIVTKGSNIKENDSVIFANFRPDRAIQISTAITNPKATVLTRYEEFKNICFVSMMLYSENVKGLVNFGVQKLDNMYGDVISERGLTQLRIAETEKYAHVTYFFDGGVDKELKGETRILIPSPKVATFDLKPEMSAYEVTDYVLKAIESKEFDTIILNYANCDMVGHTAVFDATVKAVETVDECVGKVYDAVEKVGGTLIITADHGNADEVFDENNQPFSAHTTNPVPFLITRTDVILRETGNLGDITPTMLELLNEPQPVEMTGHSMIKGYKK
ncbi:MAG: 2,3-bisphosphoglycerate-independent phosphoglycerate mutase [Mollicutes bacterium]|nr:2,3-bisphosphoglycerate-independent phosphoglycerate mutase [Mollicutes bacterium]